MANELGSDCICGVIRIVIGLPEAGATQGFGAVDHAGRANVADADADEALPPVGGFHAIIVRHAHTLNTLP